MTFSDERVIGAVNRDFVAVWRNIRPDEKYPDGTYAGYGTQWLRQLGNGTAPQNVASLLSTPEGEILHAVSGYWRPDEYVLELAFARRLFAAREGRPGAHARRGEEFPEGDLRRQVHARLTVPAAPRLDDLLRNTTAGLR